MGTIQPAPPPGSTLRATGTDLELGRIAGIRIGINWSWLVVFALITWTLASGVFPAQNPGLSDGTYIGMAIAAAILFFASLLLHELGHALQARREGVEIEGITLWLFGGVAKFKGMFPTAATEFRIAIAGPLVSLGLGLLFVVIAVAAALPEAVDGIAAWLGYINLALLVFNLLSALPLDGGRVLRSALWYFKRDYAWATRIATDVARGIAYLLVGTGLFLLIFQGSFSGAWLAFVGWFLLQAATAESRFVATQQALDGLRVRDLMTADPVTVPADLTLGRFMDDVAWSRRYTTYPVLEDGRPIGLLAFRSVAGVPRSEWDTPQRTRLDDPARPGAAPRRGRLRGRSAGRSERQQRPPWPRGRRRPLGRPALDHGHRSRARARSPTLRRPAPDPPRRPSVVPRTSISTGPDAPVRPARNHQRMSTTLGARERRALPVSDMLAWRRYLAATRRCPVELYEETEEAAWQLLVEELASLGHPLPHRAEEDVRRQEVPARPDLRRA